MCGIAGIMMRNGAVADASVLDRLESAITHRGPDGSGRYLQGPVGLLNTRLAIIDIAAGNQPFYEPEGAVLVANGEIYNDLEIRARYADAPFKTGSDCEPPLFIYRRKGLGFTDELRGMYAFAIFDSKTNELILTRDPFGIKQLYYVAGANFFAFASEPQALLSAGLAARAVRPETRAELLQLKFTTGSETIYSGIHRVMPGETLVVSDGSIVRNIRARALPKNNPVAPTHTEAMQTLDRLLTESVELHMRSEVPYGLFLSGGIDSSVLAALMSRISSEPVTAITASFPGYGKMDESEAARRVAAAVAARHEVIEITEQDFWHSTPKLAAALDDPTTDAAALPTFLLGKAAGQNAIKVVLSGEGSDEVLGGYSRYRRTSWLWQLLRRKSRTNGVFTSITGQDGAFDHWRDGLSKREREEVSSGWSQMQKLQAIDCAEWLPNDLLVKLDRCLMAHGVEGRTPYLDSLFARFAFGMPDGMKVKGKMGKHLLREWLSNALPAAGAWDKKKGFNPPIGDWIALHKDRLEPLVLRQPGIAEMTIDKIVRQVFIDPAKNSQAVWSLVFYALWHSHHVLGLASDGSIEDVLAAAAHC